jgi:CspA family cold shock protein
MRTLFIAAASALFFAAVITELSLRLWPGEPFPLLLLAFIALLLSGLLNLRLARWLGSARGAAAGPATRAPAAERPRQQPPERRPRPERSRSEVSDRAGGQRREPPPPSDAPRETGTVKWFNRTKGFGFVVRESGEEIFVHQRSIRATGEGDNRRRPALRDGQTVTFVVVDRDKGLQAEDVVPEE